MHSIKKKIFKVASRGAPVIPSETSIVAPRPL